MRLDGLPQGSPSVLIQKQTLNANIKSCASCTFLPPHGCALLARVFLHLRVRRCHDPIPASCCTVCPLQPSAVLTRLDACLRCCKVCWMSLARTRPRTSALCHTPDTAPLLQRLQRTPRWHTLPPTGAPFGKRRMQILSSSGMSVLNLLNHCHASLGDAAQTRRPCCPGSRRVRFASCAALSRATWCEQVWRWSVSRHCRRHEQSWPV